MWQFRHFAGCSSSKNLFTQSVLNDLVRDLDLSKEHSELLASGLKGRKCFSCYAKVTSYLKREQHSVPFFSSDDNLVYCNDIIGLVKNTRHVIGLFL
jgi:hypothetical protein